VLPAFRDDGYLPNGVHPCPLSEATFRFGSGSKRRKRLAVRVRHWIALCTAVGARRFFLDGSFVTDKKNPHDVDAVVLLPADFETRVQRGDEAALELHDMLLTRQPEELFAAEDDADWNDWVEFFTRTREADGRRKGVVEVQV
jgi:hypothetical protein